MKKSYRHSHTSEDYGAYYDERLYSRDAYDNRVWALEQEILTDYFSSQQALENRNALDFACGTGRIAGLLEKYPFHEVAGIDISEAMLKIARNKLTSTTLLKTDITDPAQLEGLGRYMEYFNYITAFRFFLNAEPELRENAVRALYPLCSKDGVVIINIHLSTRSPMFLYVIVHNLVFIPLIRLGFDRFKVGRTLHVEDVKTLFRANGFEMVDVKNYAYLPPPMAKILPLHTWMRIEAWLAGRGYKYSNYFMCFFRKISNFNPDAPSPSAAGEDEQNTHKPSTGFPISLTKTKRADPPGARDGIGELSWGTP